MATYPRTQNKILALTGSMIAGYSEHPGDFPSADVAALITARDQYEAARDALLDAQSDATKAAVEKAKRLEQLQMITKAQLKRSEVDTAANPVKLTEIGWSPKADPHSMQPPSQPGTLKIIAQGIGGEQQKGLLSLQWRKSAFKRARFVLYYSVQRRQMAKDQTDPNGPWQHIASAINNEITLKTEPVGSRLEYRIRAVNAGGESMPSNTVCVVL